jgi:allantoinase
MKLPDHGRYDYSPIVERKDYDWPGGKRLAFVVTTNLAWHAFGKGRGHDNAKHGEPQTQRNYSWRDYGNRIGIWRLFDVADELELPLVHNTNSVLYDYAPHIFERIRARGDEIIAHGRTNSENLHDFRWEEDEKRLIEEVTETFRRQEGRAPKGWLSGGSYEHAWTPDLLKEAGYLYFSDWPCDDQPFWMTTRAGPLMSIPYPLEVNDAPQILQLQHSADTFAAMIGRQFEEMLRQSEKQPLVCAISLHTMIMGQPHRLNVLREALRRIREDARFDRVWLTRPGEIFDHCSAMEPGTLPGGRLLA